MCIFGQGSLNASLAQRDLMTRWGTPSHHNWRRNLQKAQPFCSKLVGTPVHAHVACYFKFQALPQSLDSFSLSWHLKRDQRSPGVLLQERLNQRYHERGLISKALNYTSIRKDMVMVELLSSGG